MTDLIPYLISYTVSVTSVASVVLLVFCCGFWAGLECVGTVPGATRPARASGWRQAAGCSW